MKHFKVKFFHQRTEDIKIFGNKFQRIVLKLSCISIYIVTFCSPGIPTLIALFKASFYCLFMKGLWRRTFSDQHSFGHQDTSFIRHILWRNHKSFWKGLKNTFKHIAVYQSWTRNRYVQSWIIPHKFLVKSCFVISYA